MRPGVLAPDRRLCQVFMRYLLAALAALAHQHTLRHGGDDFQVLLDQHDGELHVVAQCCQGLADLFDGQRLDAFCGLVQQQQAGLTGRGVRRHLVEGARTLRMDVLDTLLAHLKRIKVARLAHSFAEGLDLPWAGLARRRSERLGGGRRWVSATKTGERLNLKRPS